jgi:hypothetical protein
VTALLALGWPLPATALSGNGAHALYRVRLPVNDTNRAILRVLYMGMKGDFGTIFSDFDTTVRNPARIWRLYGSINRKGTPTPDRPRRAAQVRIPARWEAVSPQQVEQLANGYARKPAPQMQPVRSTARISGSGDYSTLDVVGWFQARGYYRRELERDKHAVRCPWESEHSTIDHECSSATVVWESTDRVWPNFKCSHAHCDGRGIRDVLELWGDADAFCARTRRAAP